MRDLLSEFEYVIKHYKIIRIDSTPDFDDFKGREDWEIIGFVSNDSYGADASSYGATLREAMVQFIDRHVDETKNIKGG